MNWTGNTGQLIGLDPTVVPPEVYADPLNLYVNYFGLGGEKLALDGEAIFLQAALLCTDYPYCKEWFARKITLPWLGEKDVINDISRVTKVNTTNTRQPFLAVHFDEGDEKANRFFRPGPRSG